MLQLKFDVTLDYIEPNDINNIEFTLVNLFEKKDNI